MRTVSAYYLIVWFRAKIRSGESNFFVFLKMFKACAWLTEWVIIFYLSLASTPCRVLNTVLSSLLWDCFLKNAISVSFLIISLMFYTVNNESRIINERIKIIGIKERCKFKELNLNCICISFKNQQKWVNLQVW